MRIVVMSTSDRGGGAERVAADLAAGYQAAGHDTTIVVGRRYGGREQSPPVRELPGRAGGGIGGAIERAGRAWMRDRRGSIRHDAALDRLLGRLMRPARFNAWRDGRDEWQLPGAEELLATLETPPDVLHLHNLHGWYFDLRALEALSQRIPTVITLHDEWLFTGHCAYTLDCDRWRTGCGACPRLEIYPAIRRDGTAANWQARRDLYARCRLHVAAPSEWLLSRARASILQAADYRVVRNGLDTTLFQPGDRSAARAALGLPDVPTILSAAAAGTKSLFKDHETLQAALAILAEQDDAAARQVVLVGGGGEAGSEVLGRGLTVHRIPYLRTPAEMARVYQAADLYVQTTRADNYPRAIQEAMGCGLPVVASDVGGIPELVLHDRTGLLVPVGDAAAVAAAVRELSGDTARCERLGETARELVLGTSSEHCIRDYLAWFDELREAATGD